MHDTRGTIVRTTTRSGLRLVCAHTPEAPVTAIQLWIHAGTAAEHDTEAGLAHFVEHMVFRGTSSRTAGQAHREVAALGGTLGAWTDRDEVVFSAVVPAGSHAAVLDVLADAMSDPQFRTEDLEPERGVVLSEIHQMLVAPDRVLQALAFGQVFSTTPYGRPTYGSPQCVSAAKPEDLRRFWARNYHPRRASLAIAGAVDLDELQSTVERLFDVGGPPTTTTTTGPNEEARDIDPVLVMRAPVSRARCLLAWPAPGFTDPERPVMELARAWMMETLATGSSFTDSLIHGGLCALELPTTTDTVAADLGCYLGAMRNSGAPPAAWVEAFGRSTEQATRAACSTMSGWASHLGQWTSRAGHAELSELYLRRLYAVTPNEITAMLDGLLRSDAIRVVVLVPPATNPEPIHAAITEQLAELGTRSPRVEPAAPRRGVVVMPSGLTVVLAEDPHEVEVRMDAHAPAGLLREPPGRGGLCSWVAELLPTQIVHEAERRGVGLMVQSSSGRDTMRLRGTCPRLGWSDALAALAAGLSSSRWSPEQLEASRAVARARAVERPRHANAVNLDQFCALLYGDHPYGRPVTGTPSSIDSLTSAQAIAHAEHHLAAARWTIAISGPVGLEELERHARAVLSATWGDPSPLPPAPTVTSLERPQTHTTELAVTQHRLAYGFLGTAYHGEQWAALELLAAVLQGETGRIFQRVRDELGLAYYTGASKVDAVASGWIFGYLATKPESFAPAAECVKAEFERLRHEKIPPEVLEEHRRALVGRRIIARETPGVRAGREAFARACGITDDTIDGYRRVLESFTPEDLREVSHRAFDPQRAVTSMVVGPSRKAR